MAGIDQYTKLMLHMDDVGLTDSSSSAHTVSQAESVSRSAVQSKFGGYSAAMLPGLFTLAHHTDWDVGSGDFTVDLWFYIAADPNLKTLIGNATDPGYFGCIIQNGNKCSYHVSVQAGVWIILAGVGSHTISAGQWYHFAMVRNGGNFRGYINGELDFTSDALGGSSIYYNNNGFHIGEWSNPTGTFDGYMDELRFSKGVARWTTDFTPPESAYDSYYYEVSGNLSDDSRIYVIEEASGDTLYDGVESAGAYSVLMSYATAKTVIAVKESDGEVLGYGRVIPTAI